MTVPEHVDIVAGRTGNPLAVNMFAVFTGEVTIVLGCAGRMAGSTLAVDIDRTAQPVRRGRATMTADSRAGAVAVGNCGAALGIPG